MKIQKHLSIVLFLFSLFASMQIFAESQVCVNGKAGDYPCQNVDLLSRMDLGSSGLKAKSANDIWGWTDPSTKREYALMGLSSKMAIIDITVPDKPVHLGDLPTHTVGSVWRDIKVYKDHAFVVSEAIGHGMQVYDLRKLRNLESANSPRTFESTTHYRHFSSAHNVAINEDTGFVYAVGTNTCDGGVQIVDARTPQAPKFSTCLDRAIFEPFAAHGFNPLDHDEAYTHDIQCVNYHGPDLDHKGKEICVASNDSTLNIVDVTKKSALKQISVIGYEGHGFVHQGWLTEDHQYFLLGDETDELNAKTNTKTYVFDVRDLDKPILVGEHVHKTKSIDHNMYTMGNHVYQANYEAGLRILNLDDVANAKLEEVAYFDTVPDKDSATFAGAWSVYPYFESGVVVLSDIDTTALFVLKPNLSRD